MSNATDTNAAMQVLLAKEAIREAVGLRYSRGMDWYDLAMLKSCFHPDATLDYGYFKGNAHEWCELRIVKRNPDEQHRFHYCFPAHIEVTGETAQAESTSFAGMRSIEDGKEAYTYFGARYIDSLARRDGHWRMTHRIVQVDFIQRMPGSGPAGGLQKSVPFLTDPSPAHPLFRRLCKPD
jgi:hypothetical protein